MMPRTIREWRIMREHRFTQARLPAYLDRELASGERRRVEGHIGICPECRRVLATLRRTLERLRTLSAEPQPGVAEGVIRRLRADA